MNRIERIREALQAWFEGAQRDLPWRRTRDPYAVWISEIMLQQTRVDTVIPYYNTFLTRWPTVIALAEADPEEVRAAWSGLGYYRRARLMLDAAQTLVADHHGQLPKAESALRALPGFGRYTAGAVASIAFDAPTAAVDGNVQRVLARLDGVTGDVTRGAPNNAIWATASALADAPRPGQINQALIELGALTCSIRNPDCSECPVSRMCVAHNEGTTDRIPPPRKRPKKKRVELTALVMSNNDREVVLQRQPKAGILADLWCPPLLEGRLDAQDAAQMARSQLGLQLEHATDAGDIVHILTHRTLAVRLIAARVPTLGNTRHDLRTIPLSALHTVGIPSFTSKALRAGLPESIRSGVRFPGRRSRTSQN